MLVDSMVGDTKDKTEQEAMKVFFETNDTKIPIIIDFDDCTLCSKIISKYMLISYEDLEEYEDSEVTIMARITSNNTISITKSFYDPLKDFMKLNRTLRRSWAKDLMV